MNAFVIGDMILVNDCIGFDRFQLLKKSLSLYGNAIRLRKIPKYYDFNLNPYCYNTPTYKNRNIYRCNQIVLYSARTQQPKLLVVAKDYENLFRLFRYVRYHFQVTGSELEKGISRSIHYVSWKRWVIIFTNSYMDYFGHSAFIILTITWSYKQSVIQVIKWPLIGIGSYIDLS